MQGRKGILGQPDSPKTEADNLLMTDTMCAINKALVSYQKTLKEPEIYKALPRDLKPSERKNHLDRSTAPDAERMSRSNRILEKTNARCSDPRKQTTCLPARDGTAGI